MATTLVPLSALPREERGKNAARALRREGRTPAVFYGHGDETRALSLETHELERLLTSISVENTLIQLKTEGGEENRALIREVQWHPFKAQILHVDLYHVHAGEKITLEIPVHLVGNPIGVREEGGVLQQVRHELEVECLPRHIPEQIEIDVNELSIGDSVHIRDLQLENVDILADGELTLCSVVAPTVAAEPEEDEDEVLEPEMVGDEDAGAEDEAEAEPKAEEGEA